MEEVNGTHKQKYSGQQSKADEVILMLASYTNIVIESNMDYELNIFNRSQMYGTESDQKGA